MSTSVLNSLHDSAIECIDTSNLEGGVLLKFKKEDGKDITLALFGCEIIRVQDYVLQNIVSRSHLFCGPVNDVEILPILNWMTSLNDAPSYLSNEASSALVAKIKEKSLSLLYLEPSCGAEIAVLFKDFKEIIVSD
jgi:hypothetical protein